MFIFIIIRTFYSERSYWKWHNETDFRSDLNNARKYGKGVKNKLLGNCTQKRPFYFLYYEVVWTELDL